jgi:hypothetical protein
MPLEPELLAAELAELLAVLEVEPILEWKILLT